MAIQYGQYAAGAAHVVKDGEPPNVMGTTRDFAGSESTTSFDTFIHHVDFATFIIQLGLLDPFYLFHSIFQGLLRPNNMSPPSGSPKRSV